MLTLENIVINDGIISADVYPEDSNIFGRVYVDIEKEDLHKEEMPNDYKGAYVAHSIRELLKISKSKSIPKKRTVMWY